VGNYEIVPIEIKDVASPSGAGEEMNGWLRGNGYIELPPDIQKPYLKKGAVFLAIKIRPEGEAIELKPLWISYRSDRMEFPLRFTHDYRTFDLNLYLIHDQEPALSSRLLSGLVDKYRGYLPESLSKKIDAAAWGYFPTGAESQWADAEKVASQYSDFRTYAKLARGNRLEKVFIGGVNTTFKTKDLSQDPGL
jgi:hypothetical protein